METLDTSAYDETTGVSIATRRVAQPGVSSNVTSVGGSFSQAERRKFALEGFSVRVAGGSLGASLASTALAVNASLVRRCY